jgi:hypothetical protein
LNLRLGGAGLHYNDHSSVPPVWRRDIRPQGAKEIRQPPKLK